MTDTKKLLDLALQSFQEGNSGRTETLCRQVLEREPCNADAFHMLGILAHQRGRNDSAVEYFQKTITFSPENAEFHYDLALAYHTAGRLAEAEAGYQRALELNPAKSEAHNNLGYLFLSRSQLDLALSSLKLAVELNPRYAEACNNMGKVLEAKGDEAAAAQKYRQAIEFKADLKDAHRNLGLLLRRQDKNDQAASCLRQFLRLAPSDAEAHFVLAQALEQLKNFPEAETHFRHAVRLQPDRAEYHNALGNILFHQNRSVESLPCYEQAIRIHPEAPGYHSNLGNALIFAGRPRDAEACCRKSLTLRADSPDALHNLSLAVAAQGRFDEAFNLNERVLELQADHAGAHNVRGLWLLQRGEFDKGWDEAQWRFKLGHITPRDFAQPAWDGSSLTGKRIFIRSEQGLGDAFQFIRYAPLVKQRGGTVLVETWPPLAKILGSCPGIDVLLTRGSPLPEFDVHIPLVSLPRAFKTRLDTIPANVPYLFAAPDLVEFWRQELSSYRGFKVGIAWQGNTHFPGDSMRSIPLIYFAPLAGAPGVRLLSLQKGLGSEQLHALANLFEVVDLAARLDEKAGPFMDTAAVMKNLDLVITSDTALAHLAGALGVPVWLALAYSPDWRWLLEREDSPWYPSMRLFRQSRLGAWEDVFERMRAELTRLVSLPSRSKPSAGAAHLDAAHLDAAQTWARAFECFQANDRQEAGRLARLILDVDRNHGGALNMLGVLAHEAGQHEPAADFFSRAVTSQPDNGEFHYNLGVVFQALNRKDKAVESYEAALRLRPHHAETRNNLGLALVQLGRHDEALAHFRQALRINPRYPEAHANFGLAAREAGALEDAVFHYRQALWIDPTSAATHYNLGLALSALGEVDEALAAQEQAIRINPNHAGAHLAKAFLFLLNGNFAEGWTEYEWRWKFNQIPMYQGPVPRWDGCAGSQTILLYAEQGLGDMLQFVRYASLVKERAAKVLLACPESMMPILSTCRDIDGLLAAGTPLPPFEAQAPLLSLPAIFGTSLETIPDRVPYLEADPKLVEHWREQLGHLAGFRVGITWQGDPKFIWDRWRSIPLECFACLAWQPGLHLISLQRGAGREQMEPLNWKIPLIDFGDRMDTSGAFMDTAAIMKNLDLVITSDTAIAHLAGALGVPVWLALSYAPEWRWLREREDCPWYPSMRLFRQARLGDWGEVFARIQRELERRLRERSGAALAPAEAAPGTAPRRATVCILTYGEHPEYFCRCLDSVLAFTPLEQVELRLGFNDAKSSFEYAWEKLGGRTVGPERTLLPGDMERLTFPGPLGMKVRMWKSPVNLYKEPVARVMYHDAFLETEYTIWFDDDSYVEEGWWQALCRILDRKIDYIGQRWWVNYFPGQAEMIQAQPWYRHLPFQSKGGKLGIDFMTGGFMAVRSERLRQANFPDVNFSWSGHTLKQYGGDTLLGEIARQLGWSQAVHDIGIKINVDLQGKHPAPRRGPTGRQFGAEIEAIIL
jgi:tetratricopeptide (TPR) repeat protein